MTSTKPAPPTSSLEQPDRFRTIWKLAYPIVLSGVAQNAIDIADTAFMGHYSQVALGAMAIVALIYFGLITAGMGLATGAQILIARADGQGDHRLTGRLFGHSLLVFAAMAVLTFGVSRSGDAWLLDQLLQDKAVRDAGLAYLDIRLFGLFFAMGNLAFRGLYIGLGRTRLILYTTFAMAAINIALNTVLIFGMLGFPAMGIRGAALASVIAEGVTLVLFLIYTLAVFPHAHYGLLARLHLEKRIFGDILAKGAPIAIQQMISMAGFTYFFVLIEQMGSLELAASNVLRSIYLVFILPIIGFGTAVNTLVSNALGQGKLEAARRAVRRTVMMSFGFTLLLVPLNVLFPEAILSFYTNDAAVIAAGQQPLWVLASALLMFSVSFILFSGISGMGDTLVYSTIEITTVLIYLTYLYVLLERGLESLTIAWTAEWVFMGLMGVWSWLYLRFIGWKRQARKLSTVT